MCGIACLTEPPRLRYAVDMKPKVYIETSVVGYYFTKMMIRHAVENVGCECPEIVSPDAFLGDET